MSELKAASLIRDIPDFPKPGILFKDITPVLADPDAMKEVINKFAEFAADVKPDIIVGIESRGFVLGMPLALQLHLPFVPVRKIGKLPHDVISESYALEYGTATVEIHRDAIKPGQKVIIVDDLLATGGTAVASAKLVERLGGIVVGIYFMVELAFLPGRSVLGNAPVQSLITFD